MTVVQMPNQEQTQTSALSVRESSGAALVKPVPIPAQLQELGVKIAQDEGGLRVIILPAVVREACNLITPVSSWNQADPNWTPTINLVQLDKDSHTYPLPGGKLGLNKQALETLGKTAGVLYTKTERVPKAELQDGEMWAYRAIVGFRRSDGTVDQVTRERGFNREAEELDILDSVKKSGKYATEAAIEGECRKRWIAELRFGPAKTESKAINRALRAGLGIPASVTSQAIQKPWLVVGFNFTPDYNDPEVKRALVAIGMNAQQALYGPTVVSNEQPDWSGADVPMEASFGELPSGGAPYVAKTPELPSEDAPTVEATPAPADGGGTASGGSSDPTPAEASAQPSDAPVEAAAAPLPEPDEEEVMLAADAAEYVPPKGKYADGGEAGPLDLDGILDLGDEGRQYLGSALRKLPAGEWRTKVEAFARVNMPVEYAALVAERSADEKAA